jgi:uncharacterized protein
VIDIQERKNGVSFPVQVLPRSSRCALVGVQEGAIRLKLTSPPVEGRANEECLEFLAELLEVKKGQIDIVRGHKSRKKIVQVDGLTRERLETRLFLLLQASPPDGDAHPKEPQVVKSK